MITIVDYGLGNIKAFVNVYKRLNVPINIAKTKDDFKNTTKIILPGVGAFDYAINQLNNSGMRGEIEKKVLTEGIPVIGICVGMQILAKSSDEGKLPGLGWIDGTVKIFDKENIPFKTKLPHMGWNSINPVANNLLMDGLNANSRFYFLHSYYFVCNNKSEELATTSYGINFTSAINKNNIYGIQFHPEKSHSNGITILNNFSRL